MSFQACQMLNDILFLGATYLEVFLSNPETWASTVAAAAFAADVAAAAFAADRHAQMSYVHMAVYILFRSLQFITGGVGQRRGSLRSAGRLVARSFGSGLSNNCRVSRSAHFIFRLCMLFAFVWFLVLF